MYSITLMTFSDYVNIDIDIHIHIPIPFINIDIYVINNPMWIIRYCFTNGSKVVCVVPLLLEFAMDYYR